MITVREIEHGAGDYAAAVDLRLRVLRIPLGLEFSPEQLAAEASDRHFAAFEGDRLVGVLILTPLAEGGYHMRQVAVEPDLQGQGVGSQLVALSEQAAWASGAGSILLHARDTAVDFYLRLGYSLEGEPFTEVGIPHRLMVKQLP